MTAKIAILCFLLLFKLTHYPRMGANRPWRCRKRGSGRPKGRFWALRPKPVFSKCIRGPRRALPGRVATSRARHTVGAGDRPVRDLRASRAAHRPASRRPGGRATGAPPQDSLGAARQRLGHPSEPPSRPPYCPAAGESMRRPELRPRLARRPRPFRHRLGGSAIRTRYRAFGPRCVTVVRRHPQERRLARGQEVVGDQAGCYQVVSYAPSLTRAEPVPLWAAERRLTGKEFLWQGSAAKRRCGACGDTITISHEVRECGPTAIRRRSLSSTTDLILNGISSSGRALSPKRASST